MAKLLIDPVGLYDIPPEKSMWGVYEYDHRDEIVDETFWRTREDAIAHAERLKKMAEKHERVGTQIHVDHEWLHVGEDTYMLMDKDAEL